MSLYKSTTYIENVSAIPRFLIIFRGDLRNGMDDEDEAVVGELFVDTDAGFDASETDGLSNAFTQFRQRIMAGDGLVVRVGDDSDSSALTSNDS